MSVEAEARPAEIVIAPPGRWSSVDLGELWAQRELIYFLTKRELQIRYKQSFFGVSWAVLQPLVLGAIFALFFGHLIKIETSIPYAVFAVAGLVPWLFTAQAIGNAASSVVQDSNLISKVYFPRLALPIAKALSLTVDLAISMVVVLAVAVAYGVSIQLTFWLAPFFIALGILTAFALGTLFSAVNVKYRDVALVVPMFIQVGLFITPIVYPGTLVPGNWVYVWALNPMVSVIDGFRWALFDTAYPGTAVIAISIASAAVMMAVALWYFQRAEQWFADVI